MINKVHNYDLPDLIKLNSINSVESYLWQPDQSYLILGRSNNLLTSVNMAQLKNSPVKVYQRPSGGEAVLISPNTLIISVKQRKNDHPPHRYFSIINNIIIDRLESIGIKNLSQKGISDIAIGNKKILGSSIYSSVDTIFYHAVLNVSESVSNIAKYLKHPRKEPDYRKGKNHEDFVTSLEQEGYNFKVNYIKKILESGLKNWIVSIKPSEINQTT